MQCRREEISLGIVATHAVEQIQCRPILNALGYDVEPELTRQGDDGLHEPLVRLNPYSVDHWKRP
jgi:hypothetical protein